jgi:hypothetical protein
LSPRPQVVPVGFQGRLDPRAPCAPSKVPFKWPGKFPVKVLVKLPRIFSEIRAASKVRSKVASKVGVFQWAGATVDHPPAPLGRPLRFALSLAVLWRGQIGQISQVPSQGPSQGPSEVLSAFTESTRCDGVTFT